MKQVGYKSIHFKHHYVLLFAQRPLLEEESNPLGEARLEREQGFWIMWEKKTSWQKLSERRWRWGMVVVGTDSLSKRAVKVRESSNMAFLFSSFRTHSVGETHELISSRLWKIIRAQHEDLESCLELILSLSMCNHTCNNRWRKKTSMQGKGD